MAEIEYERLARTVASHVIDSLNAAGFGEQLAEKVADQVVNRIDVGKDSRQGWAQEYVHPAWSWLCLEGAHDECDGTAPPSEKGCHCPHHRGEPIAPHGYRLRLVLVEKTAEDHAREGGEPR